jgi:hypothetical protein
MLSNKRPQIDKFKEAARELETDDSEENFARLVKKIAKAPASKPKPKNSTHRDDR